MTSPLKSRMRQRPDLASAPPREQECECQFQPGLTLPVQRHFRNRSRERIGHDLRLRRSSASSSVDSGSGGVSMGVSSASESSAARAAASSLAGPVRLSTRPSLPPAARDRKDVGYGKRVFLSVDLGVSGIIKKQEKEERP